MTEALERCPFCGNPAAPGSVPGGGVCVRCGAEADEWNRRTPVPTALSEAVEAARADERERCARAAMQAMAEVANDYAAGGKTHCSAALHDASFEVEAAICKGSG